MCKHTSRALLSLKLSRYRPVRSLPTACTHSSPTTGHKQRQPAVGLHLRNPSLMDYDSFNQPRRDGRLSWPCWLTDSGHFTQEVVTWPSHQFSAGQGKFAGQEQWSNHYATPPTHIKRYKKLCGIKRSASAVSERLLDDNCGRLGS